MSEDSAGSSSSSGQPVAPEKMPVSSGAAPDRSSARGGRVSTGARVGFIVAVVLILLASGAGLRLAGRTRGTLLLTEPRIGFDQFPSEFCGYKWSHDQALDRDTERVLGAMYYLNRQGFRKSDSAAATLWVSYFGSPETRVDHEPQVCMLNGGWSLPYRADDAPQGYIRTEIPMPPRKDGKAWTLPVLVYLFQKDMDHVLLVTTYCVNGTYLNNRTEARIISLGNRGLGFYAQTRVTIRLTSLEWNELVSVGGPGGDPYALARNEAEVARAIRLLDSTGPTPGEKAHPYLRAVEIMRYVIPHLERHLPMAQTGAADASGP